MTLTLYSRPGCHLCEDLRTLLAELQAEREFVINEIDITGDAGLLARYRHAIPVLLRDGEEVARGQVAERDVLAALGI